MRLRQSALHQRRPDHPTRHDLSLHDPDKGPCVPLLVAPAPLRGSAALGERWECEGATFKGPGLGSRHGASRGRCSTSTCTRMCGQSMTRASRRTRATPARSSSATGASPPPRPPPQPAQRAAAREGERRGGRCREARRGCRYERNKHIFPASRWEVYDPQKKWDKYTIHGGEVNGKIGAGL